MVCSDSIGKETECFFFQVIIRNVTTILDSKQSRQKKQKHFLKFLQGEILRKITAFALYAIKAKHLQIAIVLGKCWFYFAKHCNGNAATQIQISPLRN